MLRVGDAAPDFSAATDAGATVSLSDFRGKKVVLYFYPKDDTSGCTKQACSFRDHHGVLLDHGAVVLGVSTDGVESHANFKQKYQLPFSLISDESHAIVEAYGVWQEKSLYGRTYMGTVRTTYVLDEQGVITHIFPKVTVDGHVEEVLAALTGEPQPLRLSSEPSTPPEQMVPSQPAAPVAAPEAQRAPRRAAKAGHRTPGKKRPAAHARGSKATSTKKKTRSLVRAASKAKRGTTRTDARKMARARSQKSGRRR